MKERVWIINQYSTTPEYPASSRHYELAKYLSKQFKVELWGSNFIHHNKRYRFSPWTIIKQEQVEAFLINWIGAISYKDNGVSRMLNMLLFAFTVLAVGICKREKPSIIIGSSPTLFVAFSSMLLAKYRKASFILEVRDLWPDSLVEIGGKSPTSLTVKILTWMERTLYRNAEKIIILTEGMGPRLEAKGVCSDKIFFLPNGIDLQDYSLSVDKIKRKELRNELGINDKDIIFMYAGAHGPANDLTQIIYAAQQLQTEENIKFLLIGEGVEKQALMKLANELKLNNIIFRPAVPKSEIGIYLSIADAFIICLKDIPLFNDALPNKLFDYLLHNKYIISTVKGEIEALLDKHNIGFYGNMKEQGEKYLPNVCRKVISALKMQRSSNGLHIVKKYYSREKQAQQLAKLLTSIYGGKNEHIY